MSEHLIQRAPTGENPGVVSLELVEVEGGRRHHAHRRRVPRTISEQRGRHMSARPTVHVGVRVVWSELIVYPSDTIREVTVITV